MSVPWAIFWGYLAAALIVGCPFALIVSMLNNRSVNAENRLLRATNERLRQQVQTADEAAEALLRPHPKLAVPPTYLFRDSSFLEECLAATDPAFLAGPADLHPAEVDAGIADLERHANSAGDDLR